MRAYLNFLTSSISNIINRLSLPYFTISIPIFLSYFSYTYSFPITEEFRQYLYEVIIFLTLSGNACGTIDFIQVLYFD